MDFETTSLSGSQLFQQLQSTLAQYAPDYAEEARQYEQAKDSLPEVIRLEKVLHAAYEGLFLTAMQHPKNLCQSIFTLLTKCKFRCYYIAKLIQTNVLVFKQTATREVIAWQPNSKGVKTYGNYR